jgi:TonB family protein
MKYLLFTLLISWSSRLLSQTPPSTDNPQNDTLIIEDAADTDPEFIGGFDGLVKYLNDSLRWGEVEQWVSDQKAPIGNKVIVKFVVEKNGSITHVDVESATIKCPPCNKEAVRVIQAMPAWIPGYKYDRPVRVWIRIPIIFEVEPKS